MKKIVFMLLAILGMFSCGSNQQTGKKDSLKENDTIILQPSEQEPIRNYQHSSHRSHASHMSHYSSI